jgi:4-amino-4-deoxy-L-arabinose transferase-like glycosyltransferase
LELYLNTSQQSPLPKSKPVDNFKPSERASRRWHFELILLLTLVLIAFGLRAWRVSNIGLDHFDEGVYAFSALGFADSTQPNSLFPGQIKFSPPVFFGLVGLSYNLFDKPSDKAAIFLNIIMGTLTVLLIWWIGRAWFGAEAGIAAATFLAFSEYHITLSRTALTDITFAFFFLLALALIVAAFKRQSIPFAIVAGVAVGLAWNTKYHGWFALLIAGTALVPFSWKCRMRHLSSKRFFLLWGVMALVASACYLPWALYIQSQPGGYAALAKYQRTMLDIHWFQNLWRQVQMQFFFEGLLSRSSVLVAFLFILLVAKQRLNHRPKFLFILALLSISALLVGGSITAALLSILAIPALLRKEGFFQTWVVLCWLAIWFFITPFYHPYARLVLPFTVGTYLVAGFWLCTVTKDRQHEVKRTSWQPMLATVATVLVAALAVVIPDASDPWRPSRSVSEAAAAVRNMIPPGQRVIVVGEPTVAFYLHLDGLLRFERVEDNVDRVTLLKKLRTPVFVVTGVYAKWAPELRKGLESLGNRLAVIGTFPMNPKDIRVLDDLPPLKARLFRVKPDNTYELTLYRFTPQHQML